MKAKKIISFGLTFAFAAAQCTVFADTYTPTDILKQIEEIGYYDMSSAPYDGAEYIPVRPAEGNTVCYWDWDEYEGILIYCEDGDALYDTTLGNSDMTIELNGRAARLRSLSSFMDYLNRNNSPERGDWITPELPEPYADHPENFWVLNYFSDSYRAFLSAAMEDDRFEMLGLLKGHVHMAGFFGTSVLYIEPAEGYSFDTIDWNALSEEVGATLTVWSKMKKSSAFEISYSFGIGDEDDLTYNDRLFALCEQLEARDEIDFAWISGNYYPNLEYLDFDGVEILPFKTYERDPGDVDGNGSIQPVDAMLALKGAAAILSDLQPELTEAQIALADVDKDGDLTILDAHYILRYYSDQTSGLDVSWEKLTGVSG